MLLGLDTSTAYVSVAVCDPGGGVLASRDRVGPMRHGELLAPTITVCLADAGVGRDALTGVVAGVGPGPYTGLRVGVVTALTLGHALGIEVRGVCSLDATAAEHGLDEPFVLTADARRKELFWAEYDSSRRRVGAPRVSRPEDLPSGMPVVGLPGDPVYPSGAVLARLVATDRVETVMPEPVYLRRPDAVTPGPPKKVT